MQGVCLLHSTKVNIFIETFSVFAQTPQKYTYVVAEGEFQTVPIQNIDRFFQKTRFC